MKDTIYEVFKKTHLIYIVKGKLFSEKRKGKITSARSARHKH